MRTPIVTIALAIIVAACGGVNTQPDLQATVDAAVSATQSANGALGSQVSSGTATPVYAETPKNLAAATLTVPLYSYTTGLGDTLVYPTRVDVGPDSSARNGYRIIQVSLFVENVSTELRWLPLELIREDIERLSITSPKSRVTDSRGLEYRCSSPGLTVPASISDQILLPPKFGVPHVIFCEVPNNASGMTLIMSKSSSESVSVPLPDSGTQVYNDRAPFIDPSRTYPPINEIASVPDFADITVRSAQFDGANSSWKIAIKVANQYGYDIGLGGQRGGAALTFVLYSDSGMYFMKSFNTDLFPTIPPGQVGIGEFTIQGDNSPNNILVAVLVRASGDPAAKGATRYAYVLQKLR